MNISGCSTFTTCPQLSTINREEVTCLETMFLIEGKNVVIIDDVLYSGRSVRAALTAMQSYGRPENIELLVLILSLIHI